MGVSFKWRSVLGGWSGVGGRIGEGPGGEAGREERGGRAALAEPLIWDLQGSGQMVSCLGEGGEDSLLHGQC